MLKKPKRVVTKTKDEKNAPKKLGFQGWGVLMKKFSEEQKVKEECKAVSTDQETEVVIKACISGSFYEGPWSKLSMSGYGIFTYNNGVIYEGDFDDGLFHGDGTLTYPTGIILRGLWNKGYMTERTLYFADGLKYTEEDWDYCKMPDRRFSIEYVLGLQPAASSFLTAEQPTRDIPPGCFDTVDGFYDTENRAVLNADDTTSLMRVPSVWEQKWIIENCRANPDNQTGPQSYLYESWPEPSPNYHDLRCEEEKAASSASKTGWGDAEVEDDGWRIKVSKSRARLSIVATRSVQEFGARQQKSRFRWGGVDETQES